MFLKNVLLQWQIWILWLWSSDHCESGDKGMVLMIEFYGVSVLNIHAHLLFLDWGQMHCTCDTNDKVG